MRLCGWRGGEAGSDAVTSWLASPSDGSPDPVKASGGTGLVCTGGDLAVSERRPRRVSTADSPWRDARLTVGVGRAVGLVCTAGDLAVSERRTRRGGMPDSPWGWGVRRAGVHWRTAGVHRRRPRRVGTADSPWRDARLAVAGCPTHRVGVGCGGRLGAWTSGDGAQRSSISCYRPNVRAARRCRASARGALTVSSGSANRPGPRCQAGCWFSPRGGTPARCAPRSSATRNGVAATWPSPSPATSSRHLTPCAATRPVRGAKRRAQPFPLPRRPGSSPPRPAQPRHGREGATTSCGWRVRSPRSGRTSGSPRRSRWPAAPATPSVSTLASG